MSKKLENKVAIIVAATRGIGLASAKILAKHGAKVYLGVRRLEAGQEIVREIVSLGGLAKAVYFDASDTNTYKTMFDEIIQTEDKIDIVVNNYGGTNPKTDKDIVNTNLEDFNSMLLANIDSVFLSTKYAVPHMKNGGSIINISSMASVMPDVTSIAYATCKSAVNTLTKNIATAYGKQSVRCNAILPGMIATEAVSNNLSPEFIQAFLRHVPLNRVGKVEDIANTVLFFASDDSSYITGQCIEVAGGINIPTPFYADIAGR